ncbi:MAG: YdeI/OmpD-associated family protein [Planctomycetota bacterium]
MVKKNPKVDGYIEEAAEFARPILKRLRSAFHKGCPQAEETLKWGIPTFVHNGIVGNFAAFKKHVSVGFWKSKEMQDPAGILQRRAASMCNAKFESLKDVPTIAVLAEYVAQAAELNAEAKAKPKKKKAPKPLPPVPKALQAALNKNKKAKAVFLGMSTTQKRDYIEWIDEAKREETVQKRVATALEWIAEGKGRNWKYEPQHTQKTTGKKSKSRSAKKAKKKASPKKKPTSKVAAKKKPAKKQAKKKSTKKGSPH